MSEEINTSIIEETAESILNSLPELDLHSPTLDDTQTAERNFLRQVFRPMCYYLAAYKVPFEDRTLINLITTITKYNLGNLGLDGTTLQTLTQTYNPQTAIDWDTQSKQIRDPQNLSTNPSPEPLIKLSQAVYDSLPKEVRQHLALVFYFG